MSFSHWKWPSDDAGAVGEGEEAAGGGELMREPAEEAAAEVLEVFEVGFADLAQQEAFQAGEALAVVHAHLGEEPEGFAAAAGAAVADGGGAVRAVAEAGGGAGGELLGLEEHAGADEVLASGRGDNRRAGRRRRSDRHSGITV